MGASNLDSVFSTFKSGADGYSSKFSDHSYNVANAGVVAAKQRGSFLSTLNSTVTPTIFAPAGISYQPTIDIETIGGVIPTAYTTNFMINGKALCVVNESSSDTDPGRYGFTKVGTFFPDKDGNFVNHVGQYLKVVATDTDGNPLVPNMAAFDQLTTLNLKQNVGLPQATNQMTLSAGLPGAEAIGAAARTQSKIVYDAKGNQYNVTMSYQKVALQAGDPAVSERWRIKATATTATAGQTATPITVDVSWTNGIDVVFQDGLIIQLNDGNAVPVMTLTPPVAAAATPFDITMDLGTVGQRDGLTVYGGSGFIDRDIEANGKGSGLYSGFTWDSAGYGIVSYSNGTSEIICRLPLITFKSINSLIEGSGGVFYSSEASGPYTIRFPQQSEIRPSTVEGSTASPTETYVAMAQDGKRFNACIGGIGKTISMLDVLEQLLMRS